MRSLGCVIMLVTNLLFCEAQQLKTINGKIKSENNTDIEIFIKNTSLQQSTISKNGGFFEIAASIGDTLVFSSIHYKEKKIVVSENDFQKTLLFISLEPIMNLLNEVSVKQNKINAVDMGIISKNQKTFTPAERKLNTAKNFYFTFNSGIRFTLDPILNAISGRTVQLKKNVQIEKKEFIIAKTDYYFEESFFIDTLQIPQEYVKGFQYYIVDDVVYNNALKDKNKTMASFRMGELAANYLKLINEK